MPCRCRARVDDDGRGDEALLLLLGAGKKASFDAGRRLIRNVVVEGEEGEGEEGEDEGEVRVDLLFSDDRRKGEDGGVVVLVLVLRRDWGEDVDDMVGPSGPR